MYVTPQVNLYPTATYPKHTHKYMMSLFIVYFLPDGIYFIIFLPYYFDHHIYVADMIIIIIIIVNVISS